MKNICWFGILASLAAGIVLAAPSARAQYEIDPDHFDSPNMVPFDQPKEAAAIVPKLAPHNPGFRDLFANNPELAEATAKRNGTLQGAYFIIATRALGLDCGPMSGFDNAKVDEEFFGSGVQREGMGKEYVPGTIKSNFLCNIGYGDPASVHPRAPRLDFSEVCRGL